MESFDYVVGGVPHTIVRGGMSDADWEAVKKTAQSRATSPAS